MLGPRAGDVRGENMSIGAMWPVCWNAEDADIALVVAVVCGVIAGETMLLSIPFGSGAWEYC